MPVTKKAPVAKKTAAKGKGTAKPRAPRKAAPVAPPATIQVTRPQKGSPTSWRTVMAEKLVPVNNGFGSWDGFLFGEFTEIGQKCLNMADHVSLDEALVRGGANFDVGMVPASYTAQGYPLLQVEGHNVTYRTDTGEALGVVGNGYTPFQNRLALGVAHDIDVASRSGDVPGVPEGGNFIGLAQIDNGRQVAAIYALPALSIGEGEEVIPVLLIWTSHDGSRACEVQFVPVRVACFNGNLWHVEGSSSIYRVKHTVNGPARLAAASDALAEGSNFFALWAAEASALASAKIDLAQADAYLAAIVEDKGKGKKADTIRLKTIDAIRARYLHSENLQNVQGTKYALLQAVSEYADYDHRTRVVDSGNMTVEAKDAQLRFLRATSAHPLKSAAHRILVAA